MDIREFLKDNIILLDGATGTMLHKRGLALTERSETVNLTDPEAVYEIHKAYYDAGSDVVATNTFGANPLYYDAETLDKIYASAFDSVKRAKRDSVSKREKYIALDVGPTGRLLQPYGDLGFDQAVETFAEMIRLGVKYGADLIMIETMNDGYETKAALLAAKENCDLPVFVANAYSENGKLLTGAPPEAVAVMLESMGADAIGVNCSFGPDASRPVSKRYLDAVSIPVIMKANAGLPRRDGDRTYFDIDAEQFADTVGECIKDGITVIGGCCGTTPEYIAALRKRIDGMAPVKRAENTETVVSSSRKTVRFSNGPVLIGERINPTGKKRFKQALTEGDIDYITNEGLKQEEAGAHILDVNVGTPEVDEVSMLTTVVTELQTVTDLPLQIDTANGFAMEKALRYYNGCPLINSVNGKAESMETVFPLVKKYGGVVVALTLDEKGIPATAEGRLEIAEKILKTAERYGVKRKNVVFDTLTMTVSTDKNAAKTTLDALKLIKEKTGCHTVLGVSNVSFGLPERSLINGSFFTMALYAGLSSAIMNPLSAEMMKSYRAYRALAGLDENFKEYTEYAAQNPAAESVTTSKSSKITTTSDLCDAVIKGMKEQAEKLTEELLADTAPLSIIEQKIMPALDVVGADYESGKIFLPQLLMAAEAAKAAFERIRQKAETTGQSGKGYFVLATVEGDIHDIGKNIVKLLLQNYGFDVIDLGKDVPAAVIVDKVLELHSKFAGLSALMTTTLPSMEKTVSLLHQKAPFCKVVVGGAVLTQEYADKIGADKYAKDAMETVRYALSVSGSKE